MLNQEKIEPGEKVNIISSTSLIENGIIQFEFPQFSQMKSAQYSQTVEIHGIPWRIMITPRQHFIQNNGYQKCLGCFLESPQNSYSDGKSCHVHAKLSLVSQNYDTPNFSRRISHGFNSNESDYGYSCLMTWADIVDESRGYIKNDTIKLEANITALEPTFSPTHFMKKIEDCIDFANVYARKRFLNKAIEFNGLIKEICKNQNHECKDQIDAQFEKFTQMKKDEMEKRYES